MGKWKAKGNSWFQWQSKKNKAPIPTLPLEIITEILLRLPVHSLLRFRCVSKSWRSLISSPHFIKTHLTISTNNKKFTHHRIMFTCTFWNCKFRDYSLRSLLYKRLSGLLDVYPSQLTANEGGRGNVVGSCNGLVCIAIDEKHFYMWNPSVRRVKKLPMPIVDVDRERRLPGFYGFGFDEANKDYKVVGVFRSFGMVAKYETIVQVYSLKTNSWRRIEYFKGGLPLHGSSEFVHGKLHWYVIPAVSCGSTWDIVSLDVETETYGVVEQPNYGAGGFGLILGVLGGCVCVLCSRRTHADVWVLKEYAVKESWTKVVTIPYTDGDILEHIIGSRGYVYSVPLFILPEGEVVLALGSSFVVYNPKKKSFIFRELSDQRIMSGACLYIESLVLPFVDGGYESHTRKNDGKGLKRTSVLA